MLVHAILQNRSRDWGTALLLSGESPGRKCVDGTIRAWNKVYQAEPSPGFPELISISSADPEFSSDTVATVWPKSKTPLHGRSSVQPAAAFCRSMSNGTSHRSALLQCLVSPKVKFVRTELLQSRVKELMASRGIHVAIAEMEGFGHTQNEARASAALVISVDLPVHYRQ